LLINCSNTWGARFQGVVVRHESRGQRVRARLGLRLGRGLRERLRVRLGVARRSGPTLNLNPNLNPLPNPNLTPTRTCTSPTCKCRDTFSSVRVPAKDLLTFSTPRTVRKTSLARLGGWGILPQAPKLPGRATNQGPYAALLALCFQR